MNILNQFMRIISRVLWLMDKKRILSLLNQLDSYVRDLEQHTPKTLKVYEKNIEKKRFCERTVQLAIEVCIDISQLLVKELQLGLPNEEETIFDTLATQKIISAELKYILKGMKRFRNILIHKYVEIDDAIVFEKVTRQLGDFKQFKKELISYLKK